MVSLTEAELQSKTIEWLRFPLAVLVVFIHMFPFVDIQNIDYLNLNFYNFYDIIRTLISHILGLVAVPCFFMFSGYWFFNKVKEWNKTVYFSKVKTRLKTLIVPYFMFNIAAVIFVIIQNILKADGSIYPFLDNLRENWYSIFWNYNSWDDNIQNILGQTIQPSYGPFVLPLWFLRDLIVMVFISPVVYYLIKYAKIWGVVTLGLFYYTKIWIEIPGYSAQLFLTAFFFFSLGAFFGINRKNIVVSLRKYQNVWLVISLIIMISGAYYYGTSYNTFFLPIFTLSGVISIINITSYYMKRGKLKVRETLSKASFFLYCTHIFILRSIKEAFDKIIGVDNTMLLLIEYFIIPFLITGIILCVYLLMKRFTPKLLSLFTGSR